MDSVLLDRGKYSRVSYVRGEAQVLRANRDPLIKKSTPLGPNGVFEIEKHPKKVVLDMPTAIGVCILSGAKLKMLSFIYDFVVKYFRYKSSV